MLRNLSRPFTVVIRNNLRMHKHQILTMLSPDLVKFHARDGVRRRRIQTTKHAVQIAARVRVAAFKQTIEQIDFSQFLFGYDN